MPRTFKVAGTGHRPDKLGGYNQTAVETLTRIAEFALVDLSPTHVISGMALGWDQALARASIRLSIPLIAAVPFVGQEKMWPEASQIEYRQLLEKCLRVEIVSKGVYSAAKMQLRNQWMVDHCHHMAVLWNGTAGGTANCVRYVEQIKKPMTNYWFKFIS